MTLRHVLIHWLLWAVAAQHCSGQGLVLDPSQDVGAQITSGTFRQAVTANGGLYEQLTTARIGQREGAELDFQGVMIFSRFGRVRNPRNNCVVIWWKGPERRVVLDKDGNAVRDKDGNEILESAPAFDSGAHGTIYDGVNVWRRQYIDDYHGYDDSTAFRFANPASTPKLTNCSAGGFGTVIRFAKSNHIEHATVENITIEDCGTFFCNEESQAVGHEFRCVYVRGACETLFKLKALTGNDCGGGNIEASTVVTNAPCRVFDVDYANQNSGTLRLTNWKADNGSKGWRLVRVGGGRLSLYVRGRIGEQSAPAADAIEAADQAAFDIELDWQGRKWPRDFKVIGDGWGPK